jgi:hypothetical protein
MLRTEALRLAGPQSALVLDCYAGIGHMYDAVWKKADRYLGIDKRFSRKPGAEFGQCWKGDNERLIERAMQHVQWNIVDLDAYGSPWVMLRRVLELAKAPRLIVTATCGLSRPLMTKPPALVLALSGTEKLTYHALLYRWYDDIIRWHVEWAMKRASYTAKRVRRIRSGPSRDIWYYLLEFERSKTSTAAQ